jgi:hypothetical protein
MHHSKPATRGGGVGDEFVHFVAIEKLDHDPKSVM